MLREDCVQGNARSDFHLFPSMFVHKCRALKSKLSTYVGRVQGTDIKHNFATDHAGKKVAVVGACTSGKAHICTSCIFSVNSKIV